MKLEVGKYYRTRDGRKVGPMYKKWPCDEEGDVWGYNGSMANYSEVGIRWTGVNEPESDIIAEWTDEQSEIGPKLSGDTIDKIAIDSLKWHYATEMQPLEKEAFRIVLRYYGVTL